MTGPAFDRVRGALEKLGPVKPAGAGISARCPAHDDGSPSLSVTPIEGQVLVYCHAGCASVDVVAGLGLAMADLFDSPRGAEYRYPGGRIVHRSPDKKFRQSGNTKDRNMYHVDRVVEAVAADRPVYVTEGEKDVHALEAVGVTATCSPMGAGKWSSIDPSPLYGARVVVVADRDEAGDRHTLDIAESLTGRADFVVVHAKSGKDAADHVAAGDGLEEFQPVELDRRDDGLISSSSFISSTTPIKSVRPMLADDAYQGLPGRVVRAIEPHTEADPAAMLVTFLGAAGAILGREAHTLGGDAEHAARLWPLVIGATAGGMKGTSWSAIRRVILAADPLFSSQITSGLSSGEGLIEHVRDGEGDDPDAKDYVEGVPDKRLIIVESEFSGVLGKARREGNVLTQTLRDAWDGTRLSTLTRKSSKLVSTDHHVVIIGHVTPTELRASLSESDLAGGLMNRFLPVHSHRSKRLPGGGSTPSHVVEALGKELSEVIQRNAGGVHRELRRDPVAETLWRSLYDELTPDNLPDGPLAQVVARAVPQVLRLSLVYALLDGTGAGISHEHLSAAMAVWRYVEASARMTFGDVIANRDLNRLAAAVDRSENGLTRTEIVDLFDRNRNRREIDELLRQLVATGGYNEATEATGGRPTTRYLPHRQRDKRDKRDKAPAPALGRSDDGDNSFNSFISSTIPAEPVRTCGHPGDATKKCGVCTAEKFADRAATTASAADCRVCDRPVDPDNPAGLCGLLDADHRMGWRTAQVGLPWPGDAA